ncbi:MAG: hypothetical protein DPW18_17345 [Chloroflexi bacterium]|nr:hypothetical protein [Chloroflexota bacterium]MDL1941037.1 GyrI-like domain-containing protein [Chloroflexi bacterium CFX2]
METTIQDIEVMFVESPNGPAGSGEAFNKLESSLETLKGRKFYATFQYATGVYRACVEIEDPDEPERLGFQKWSIPGGLFAQEKLKNWTEHADEIPDLFDKMSQEYKGRIDSSRPSIEFYKSQKELILLLPILR